MLKIYHPSRKLKGAISLPGSKSESNRWLILQALFPEIQQIDNLSDSEDTQVLNNALQQFSRYQNSEQDRLKIDVHHAGTAMRFLTAFFAIQPGSNVLLTGSKRMQQRPIAPLVNALNDLGADISYVKEAGYPPLKIKGKPISGSKVRIQSNISSQYISALMLIGASLPNGLSISFDGELTSKPYVEMTLQQLRQMGIDAQWTKNGIQIFPKSEVETTKVVVESDWSAASYWYSMLAIADEGDVKLSSFSSNSLQGDAMICDIYAKYFGVHTDFQDDQIALTKNSHFQLPQSISLDLNQTPDLAQTIALTCASLGIKAKLTGLHTLKIKETDRLVALQNELEKLGVKVEISSDEIHLLGFTQVEETPVIETYQDHRMAMSFAPISLKRPLWIKNPEVVGKSYPSYWLDLANLEFALEYIE